MVIMTNEIMNRGISRSNGWGRAQLRVLGIRPLNNKGWRKQIIGEEYPERVIQEFLDLKNKHLKKGLRKKKKKKKRRRKASGRTTPIVKKIPWKKQYKHPSWKQKRLKILKRDGHVCTKCGDKDSILHVHHLKYKRGGYIWEVEDEDLITLCEACHEKEHGRKFTY